MWSRRLRSAAPRTRHKFFAIKIIKLNREKVENDILWINKVVDIRKETDEERKEKNELKMKKVFE